LQFAKIGKVKSFSEKIIFAHKNKKIIDIKLEIAKKYYENISNIMKTS
jgi:hypothetical protein